MALKNLLGFIFKTKDDVDKPEPSFAPPENDDSAVVLDKSSAFQSILDMEGVIRSERELVTRYRQLANIPEVDAAINEITNEAVNVEQYKNSVSLVTDKLIVSDETIGKIRAEFENVMNLLDFNNEGQDIFRKWYVDGRLVYHMIIDNDDPREGIKEIRSVDPRLIKPVIEKEHTTDKDGMPIQVEKNRYYVFGDQDANAVPLAWDSVCYVHSGLKEPNNTMIYSHLHKAIKPANMLGMVEDAVVIYRLSRAPERRIFLVDTGNLPPKKAEAHLQQVMNKYRNKTSYDAATGEVRDDRKFLSLLEDYWLPRTESGRGTDIKTLEGGQNLGIIQDVEYFKEKLYQSLNVPVSRLKPNTGLAFDRASQVTREELNFGKFINRLRNRFTHLFDVLLSTQLRLKGIVGYEDWQQIRQRIFYDFLQDGYFSEAKDLSVLRDRLAAANQATEYTGRFYSNKWIRQSILNQTEQEMKEMDEQIAEEADDPQYQVPLPTPIPLPPPPRTAAGPTVGAGFRASDTNSGGLGQIVQ